MKENKVNLHEKKTLSRIVASDQVQRVSKVPKGAVFTLLYKTSEKCKTALSPQY